MSPLRLVRADGMALAAVRLDAGTTAGAAFDALSSLDALERAATIPRGIGHAWGWVCAQACVAAVADRRPAEVRLRPRAGAAPRVRIDGAAAPLVSISQHGRHAVAVAWDGTTPHSAGELHRLLGGLA